MMPIDFLRASSRPKMGWVLLVLGASAFIAAASSNRHYAARKAEAEAVAQRQVQSALERARPVSPAPPSAVELRLRQAMVESRLPWVPALRVIESKTHSPVYLRSLRFDPAQSEIKLEADSPSFAEALAYVEELDQMSLLGPAQLTSHHEVADGLTRGTLVRFSVTTRWNHQ
jgi:hypothetical protein